MWLTGASAPTTTRPYFDQWFNQLKRWMVGGGGGGDLGYQYKANGSFSVRDEISHTSDVQVGWSL